MPLPKPIDSRLLHWFELPAMAIPVVPVNDGRKSLVVDDPGEGCSNPGSFLSLLLVEGPPFRPVIEESRGYNEAASLADEFPSLIVSNEVSAPAFRARFDSYNLLHQDAHFISLMRGLSSLMPLYSILFLLVTPVCSFPLTFDPHPSEP